MLQPDPDRRIRIAPGDDAGTVVCGQEGTGILPDPIQQIKKIFVFSGDQLVKYRIGTVSNTHIYLLQMKNPFSWNLSSRNCRTLWISILS